jgi:hypothetical protein
LILKFDDEPFLRVANEDCSGADGEMGEGEGGEEDGLAGFYCGFWLAS